MMLAKWDVQIWPDVRSLLLLMISSMCLDILGEGLLSGVRKAS